MPKKNPAIGTVKQHKCIENVIQKYIKSTT